MTTETIGGIPVEKIREIDARANDTKKKCNEKPLKIDMPMDELAKLLMTTPKQLLFRRKYASQNNDIRHYLKE